MAKLYYIQGEKEVRKKRYLAVTLRYKYLFFLMVALNLMLLIIIVKHAGG